MSLLTPMLRSSPLTNWFSDAQRVQGMLDFEAALAQAQAACGLVPPEAVGPIVAAATRPSILPRWARRRWEPVTWPSRW
mgnify:CR=1 FL=1